MEGIIVMDYAEWNSDGVEICTGPLEAYRSIEKASQELVEEVDKTKTERTVFGWKFTSEESIYNSDGLLIEWRAEFTDGSERRRIVLLLDGIVIKD